VCPPPRDILNGYRSAGQWVSRLLQWIRLGPVPPWAGHVANNTTNPLAGAHLLEPPSQYTIQQPHPSAHTTPNPSPWRAASLNPQFTVPSTKPPLQWQPFACRVPLPISRPAHPEDRGNQRHALPPTPAPPKRPTYPPKGRACRPRSASPPHIRRAASRHTPCLDKLLSTISDLPNSCSVFHADSCNHDQQHLLFKAGALAYVGTC
jgi:hypothetical protein